MNRIMAAVLVLVISGIRVISLDEGVYEITPTGLVLWFTQNNSDGSVQYIDFTHRGVEAR